MPYNPTTDPKITIPEENWNVGFGLHIKIFPCSIDPFVALDLAWPAACKAFAQYVSPNEKSAIKDFTGRSWLKSFKLLGEDAIELVEVEDTLGTKALRFLWRILELEDQAIFWLWIVGLAFDTFVEWSTQVYEASGCLPAPDHHWIRSGSNDCVYAPNADWQNACAWTNCYTSYGSQTSAGYRCGGVEDQFWSVIWQSEWGDFGGHPIATEQRLVEADSGQVLDQAGSFGDLFDPKQWSMLMYCDKFTKPGAPVCYLQARNISPTSVVEVIGDNGTYFYERYSTPPAPIVVS